MGRDKTRTDITLKCENFDNLKVLAEKMNTSMSDLIDEMIENRLSNKQHLLNNIAEFEARIACEKELIKRLDDIDAQKKEFELDERSIKRIRLSCDNNNDDEFQLNTFNTLTGKTHDMQTFLALRKKYVFKYSQN